MTARLEELNSWCKGGDMGFVAVSHGFYVMDEDGETVPFEGYNGRLGLKDIMEALKEFWPVETRTEDGHLTCCSRQMSSFKLGPVGQFELALAPVLTVAELKAEYKNALYRLQQILEPVEYRLAWVGYNPHESFQQLQAMPWVQKSESAAQGCATLSVRVDYASEADAVTKLRLAALLSPLLAFIADNAVVVDGEAASQALRCLQLRMGACDLFAAGVFEPGFGFANYEQQDDQDYAVKLQDGLVLNIADSLPVGSALSYIALVKGLFYSPTNVELLAHFLLLDKPALPWNDQSVAEAVDAIATNGSLANVYGRAVDSWVDLLFRMAADGLGTEDAFLEELKDFKAF